MNNNETNKQISFKVIRKKMCLCLKIKTITILQISAYISHNKMFKKNHTKTAKQ